MNIVEWKRAIEAIHGDFYEDLVTTAECGAFDGGGVVVAQALRAVIGGEIVSIVDANGTPQFAAVECSGKLWDYAGPLGPQVFIARLNRIEKPRPRCAGWRPMRADDFPYAYRDAVLVERLAALFRRVLPVTSEEASPPRDGDGAAVMSLDEWDQALEEIHGDIYDDLHETVGCDAFDGGSLVVAQALRQVIGGMSSRSSPKPTPRRTPPS